MAETERKPATPAWILVILTLLGLSTLQKGSDSDSGAKSTASSETKTSQPRLTAQPRGTDSKTEREAKILEPLFKHFKTDPDEELKTDDVLLKADGSGQSLFCLIATVPDYVQSTNSHRFDEFLDAIQRGVESEGYVLDGYRIPWDEGEPAKETPDRSELTVRWKENDLPLKVSTKTTPPPTDSRQPGLIVFRRVPKSDEDPRSLLLVFLVPEVPTFGLDKGILWECLGLAKKLDNRNRHNPYPSMPCPSMLLWHPPMLWPDFEILGPSISQWNFYPPMFWHPPMLWPGFEILFFNILGPCFSGSQSSLGQTLREWKVAVAGDESVCFFEIISGTAAAIDREHLIKKDISGCFIEFKATVHTDRAVLRALLDYIGQSEPVALIVESNTAKGMGSVQGVGKESRNLVKDVNENLPIIILYRFPPNISQLRSSYEKKGLLRDRQSQTLRSAERLTIPFDDEGKSLDVIEPKMPGITSAIGELTLDQILTDITRRRIHKVGIVATDPLDVIFLARKVSQFCPDAALFTTPANLLFTHPEHIGLLRGMLVGSTYPLFPQNQTWSYPYTPNNNYIFFASAGAQGIYNATVAHFGKLGVTREPDQSPRFLEYGMPFDPPTEPQHLPIWISAIGYRGIYPVHVTKAELPNRYDLRLMCSVKDVSGIPTEGKNLIIVATVDNVHHFRIFDGDDNVVVDTDEKKLTGQALQINKLRKQLMRLCPPHELTGSERDQVITTITSIFGNLILNKQLYQNKQPDQDDDNYVFQHHQDKAEFAGYPVNMTKAELPTKQPDLDDDNYVFQHDQDKAEFADFTTESQRDERVPYFGSYWLVLFASLTLACLVLVFVSSLVANWVITNQVEDNANKEEVSAYFKGKGKYFSDLAQFLNCCWSESAAKKQNACRGPGLYLSFALFVLLSIYLAILGPTLNATFAVPWMPFNVWYRESWISAIAFLTVCSMVIALVFTVIPASWLLNIRSRWRSHKIIIDFLWIVVFNPSVIIMLLVSILAFVCPPPFHLASLSPLAPDQRNLLLSCARSRIGTSGVSPVLPMIFLGLAWGAWIFAQLKKRYIFDQTTPQVQRKDKDKKDKDSTTTDLNQETMEEIRNSIYKFNDTLEHPIKSLWRQGRLFHLAPMLLLVGYFIYPLVSGWCLNHQALRTYEGLWFQIVFWIGLIGVFVLLTFHFLRLINLWNNLHQIMKLVLRLPLIQALNRLPPRVASWFFETPMPGGGQFDLVKCEASFFAMHSSDRIRDEAKPLWKDERDWKKQWADLKTKLHTFEQGPAADPNDLAMKMIREILLAYWKTRSVVEAFADSHASGGAKAGASKDSTSAPDDQESLRDWARHAEDLWTLMLMRRLSAAMAQIWTLIGWFLVPGSVFTLFAISTYPFPFQDHMMQCVELLIGVLAVVILRIVVVLNRDELLSRAANTPPNQFKLDSNLISSLVIYIVPILGVIAALSLDVSDTMRSVLDPLLRHFR